MKKNAPLANEKMDEILEQNDRKPRSSPLDPKEDWLREIIRFQHAEIYRRYDREALERNPEIMEKGLLARVSRKDIEQIRELFVTLVYPSYETRARRDQSFASLVKLLKSPQKLAVMVPAIPKIMLRFSYRFPLALRAGLDSVLAYILSMNVENRMLANLLDRLKEEGGRADETARLDLDAYRDVYARIPYKDFQRLIHLARRIALTAKTPDIMFAAREIMQDVMESMKRMDGESGGGKKKPRYQEDIRAISFGLEMLNKVIEVFGTVEVEKIGPLIEILTIVEAKYLNGMHPEAAAGT